MIIQVNNLLEKKVVVKYFNHKYGLRYAVSENDKTGRGYVCCGGEVTSFTTNYETAHHLEKVTEDSIYTFSAFAAKLLNEYIVAKDKLSSANNLMDQHYSAFKEVFKL